MFKGGYIGKVLRIDLSNRNVEVEALDEKLARQYIGGKGMAAKLLFDHVRAGVDPLSPENPLILTTGPLTGTAAYGPSAYFSTKSPLTGGFLDSGVRGHFGARFKLAGYDAAIITGRAEAPVYIWINNDQVEIRDAAHIWGKDAHETDRMIKEEQGTKDVHVAAIGPGGENGVRYACISVDLFRQAGRGGNGTVMGSKNLKAIAVRGTGRVKVANPEKFMDLTRELVRMVVEGGEPLHTLGTMWLMDPMNDYGILPTRNFQTGVFKGIKGVNGDYMLKRVKVRDVSCYACAMSCSNFCSVHSKRYGSFQLEGPEYETANLLGPNCGLDDLEAIAYINLMCDRLGIDTMSVGGTIAFAMELWEKGILTAADTGGLDLTWGNQESMVRLIEMIARREGIGAILADGSRRAAQKIGRGADNFAIHVKGMECPGYDPRGVVGMGLAYATADRGACHLRAWTIYEELMGNMDRYSIEGKAELVKVRQDRKVIMDSLGICEQMGLLPIFAPILSAATGWKVEPCFNKTYPKLIEDFVIEGDPGHPGDRTNVIARLFNMREGFTRADDTLPDRFFAEELPEGSAKGHKIDRRDFEVMLDQYYAIRGWDRDGRPTPEKMAQLGGMT